MKYYSIHRPISIGTYPKTKRVIEFCNFDCMQYCPEIKRSAWGWIEYEGELDYKDANNYELLKAH